jgi:glutathione reductase (NADPH)
VAIITYDYDLYIIGAGSGGVRAARVAAGHGARVGIAEASRVGGTCVIRGCIPKKLLAYAAHYRGEFEDAVGFGWTVDGATFDWSTLIANKDREIDRLNGVYIRLLDNADVDLHETRAGLVDPHTIALADGRRFTTEHILIATGGRPSRPQLPGVELAITSDDAFHLKALPKSVVIVGGGYIALEFAGIFSGLGSRVTLVHRGPKVLRGFDEDVRSTVAEEMSKRGVTFRLETTARAVERRKQGLALILSDGEAIEADTVMFATGRRPNTDGMGLEEVGVTLAPGGAVAVDEWSRSSIANIHAIGDATDRMNLTPVAIREGHAFADTVFGRRPWATEYDAVPTAVFLNPPIGVVGLTEVEARARGPVDVYRTRFRPLRHTLSGRDEKTFMKLVVDRASGVVLGAHMVGEDAPEIIQAVAIAVKLGATKEQFDLTVALHPSAAEEFVTLRDKSPEPASRAAE